MQGLWHRWLAAAAVLAAAGCAGGAPATRGADAPREAAIEGTAAWRERMALPPGARFEAELQDVTRADAPAMVIARAVIAEAPNPPIRFTIPYDASRIDANHRYAVRAAVRAGGRLLFASDVPQPVLTQGAGQTVELLLRRAEAAPAADAALFGTAWRILSIAGEPIAPTPGRREPQLRLKNEDGRSTWSATVGCNQMSGGLAAEGDRLSFKGGMATLMACPPPLDMLEKRLGRSLLASVHWRIQGNRLELRDEGGVQTFLCEAAQPR
jgi:putative lipoprotein